MTESVVEESEPLRVRLLHAQSQGSWPPSETPGSEKVSAYEQDWYTTAIAESVFNLNSTSFGKRDTSTWIQNIPHPARLRFQVPEHDFETTARPSNSKLSSVRIPDVSSCNFITNDTSKAQDTTPQSHLTVFESKINRSVGATTFVDSGLVPDHLPGWDQTTSVPAYFESQPFDPFFVTDGMSNIDYSNNHIIRNYLDTAFNTGFSSTDWTADYFNI